MANVYLPDLDENAVAVDASSKLNFKTSTKSRRIERLVAGIVFLEFVTIAATCFLTSSLYFYAVLAATPSSFEYISAALLIALSIVLLSFALKQYVAIQAQPRDRFMLSGLGSVALGFSLFLSTLFLLKIGDWYSRGTFFIQFLCVAVAILTTRGTVHGRVRRAIQSGRVEARKAVLVGDVKSHVHIVGQLEQQGVRWASALSFPYVHGPARSGVEIYSPGIRRFVERCRAYKPDDIIFLADTADLPRVASLIGPLSELPASVHVIPTSSPDFWSSAKAANLGETTTIQVLRPPLSALDLSIKRTFDIVASSIGLFLLAPLLLTVSLGIKVESQGPIFFRQNRHGYNNEIIPVIKFRTMNVIEDGESATTFTQARKNDARFTRLGRVLRRMNLDELPQLINVLRGEMSLIGPRPHPIALNTRFREQIVPYSRRHNVKPGLTGWAQVNGLRGETDSFDKMARRVEYDMFYIDNWSFLFDMKILLMTLFSKSAYNNAA